MMVYLISTTLLLNILTQPFGIEINSEYLFIADIDYLWKNSL